MRYFPTFFRRNHPVYTAPNLILICNLDPLTSQLHHLYSFQETASLHNLRIPSLRPRLSYYFVEVWGRTEMFPPADQRPANSREFFWDRLLVATFAVAEYAGLAALAHATGRPSPDMIGAAMPISFMMFSLWVSP